MSTLKVPADWDVSKLNEFIAQQENFLRGPLKSITNDGDVLLLDFDDDAGRKPESNTVIATITPPPPNAKVVGTIKTYMDKMPTLGVAFRT